MSTYKDSFAVSFPQGSSGRLVEYLLYNLLSGSSEELELISETNSAHLSDRYTGHVCCNTSALDFWDTFVFDSTMRHPAPRIIHSHIFPDFKLIRDRLGENVKIIIITLDPYNIAEVIINNKVKNNHDLIVDIWATPETREQFYNSMMGVLEKEYQRYVGNSYPGSFIKHDMIQIGKGIALDIMQALIKNPRSNAETPKSIRMIENFINIADNIEHPSDQLLLLPYNEVATYNNDGYVWIQKLEKFTGKTANTVTKESYQNYVNGRVKLLKEYRL